MIVKRPIVAHKVRNVPKQFSWIDQRLVQHRHIDALSHPAAALYLFLVTVADAQGLSFWADKSICTRLAMDPAGLHQARHNLISAGLVAYQAPLYQVLAIQDKSARTGSAATIGQILKRLGDHLP